MTEATLPDLQRLSRNELEALWLEAPPPSLPRGVYRGSYLERIEHSVSRQARWRWSEHLAFERLPFGVDFDRHLWFFFSPRIALGRFDPQVGASRWRDTDAVRLHYNVSRLPAPVRNVLYDEVKPLSDRLVLGMGGINAGRDRGDYFFFALERTE
jgi:hypothetical protein